MTPEKQTEYMKGAGKIIHMIRFYQPEVLNSVREISRFINAGENGDNKKAMHRVIEYLVETPTNGI